MKRTIFATSLALALAATAPALSQTRGKGPLAVNFAADTIWVPTMANNPGLQGAIFGTQVSILNPTTNTFPVTVTLSDAGGTPRTKTITLGPGQLKVYTNFLDQVFDHFAGAGGARFQSSGGDNLFIVNAEVFTLGGTRFGTTLPTFDIPSSDAPSFAVGVTVDSGSRTNVGCLNQVGRANTVHAKVFDSDAHHLADIDLELAANAWGQKGVSGITVSGGYVQFTPQAPALCWAVVVNNGTNDGNFIPAVEYTP